MSAIDTIKSLLSFDPVYRHAPNGTKAAPVDTEYFGPIGQRNADWSGVSDNPRIRQAFGKCATAYACATYLADAVSESPLRVYRTIDGEPEEQPNHRARTIIANPNPVMSEAEFMSLSVMTMALFGYAVVEKVRSGSGLPVQLWPLRPDWLKRERTNIGSQWVYRVPTIDPRTIAPEDLLLIPYRHDEQQTQIGLSPLQIVAREIGIDVALTDLLKVFIDAGGIPPWAVEVPDPNPDQTQIDVFREKWNQRYGGWKAYNQIGILYGGMKLVKVGDSIGDMAWPDLRGLTELKIAQAFRVPADLIQARDTLKGGSLTTTEMMGAMAALQNFGAQPLRTRIDGAFSRGFLAEFTGGDPSYSLEFDTSEIKSLQENEDAKHTRIRADYNQNLITLNEARVLLGMPDLGPAGDVFPVLFNVTYLRAEELAGTNATGPLFAPVARANQTQPEAEAAATNASMEDIATRIALSRSKALPATTNIRRQYRDVKAMSPADIETRARVMTLVARDQQRLTEIGGRQLRKFFREQGKRVVSQLPSPALVQLSEGLIEIKATVRWEDEDEALRELLMRFYTVSGEKAFAGVSATVGAEIAWDLANQNIDRILGELGLRIVDISETTRLDVIKVIADGQAEGLNLQQISNNLTGMFETTYKNRAMTIARTETMVSYGKASLLGYAESGVVDRVEISDNPDHTEPYEGAQDGLTCAERHGLVVALDRADFHLMSDHPNGSCAMIPILSGPGLGEPE